MLAWEMLNYADETGKAGKVGNGYHSSLSGGVQDVIMDIHPLNNEAYSAE